MSLSGNEITRIGVLGAPGRAYVGFVAKSFTSAEIWSDATTNTSLWAVKNPTATTWDGGTTTWDFEGNVETTSWDGIDDVWTDEANTPVTWTKQ